MTGRELLDRLRPDQQKSGSMGANTLALAAARVAPMVVGFIFWALAAVSLPPARLGLGSALVSAVLLSVQLGLLGVGPATVSLLPRQGDGGRRLLSASLAAVTSSSLVVGVLLVLVTRALGGPTGAAWNSATVVAAFLAATVLATVAYQMDHVSVAQASSYQALARSIAQGIVQLAVLGLGLLFGNDGVLTLLAAVAAGALASVVLGTVQQVRRGWHPARFSRVEALLLVRHGLPNHALMLSDRAPGYLLPLVVTAAVSATATASWYMVWMLSMAVFFVPQSAGYSLQARLAGQAAPGQGDPVRDVVRKALRLSVLLTAGAAVVLVAVGPVLLAILGPVYAGGWPLLLIMAPALMVGCVTQVYYGLCRAWNRLAEATVVAVVGALIAVVPAAALAAQRGLQGVSLVWLAGQIAAGLLAAWRLWALTAQGRTPRGYRGVASVPDFAAPAHAEQNSTAFHGALFHNTARHRAALGLPTTWLLAPPRFAWGWPRLAGDACKGAASAALAVLAAAALVVGVSGLLHADISQIGSIGAVTALPVAYFPALAAAVVGVVVSLCRRRQHAWVLVWQLVVLIVLLHGLDPIIHGTPRLEASYRHLGIASYISGSGQLDTGLDAYFSWPGFFALLAMFSDATGINSLMPAATWAPLAVNLLLLPVLLAVARRLTRHWRTTWTAVWLFYLTSWVGQDYLAPQAYAFVLGLTVLAVVLAAFGGRAWKGTANRWRRVVDFLDRSSHAPSRLPRPVTVMLLVSCVLLLLAVTAAHQLTPFAVAGVLLGLTLTGQSRLRLLPVVATIIPIAWLVFIATPYLVGHTETLFGSIGDITQNMAITKRVAGNLDHRIVIATRIAESALMWVAAGSGAWVLARRRKPWLAAATCAGIPLLLLPLQPYGGELLLRVYLYSLPFTACLAAVILLPSAGRRPGLWRALAIATVGLALAGTTLVTRYGNDAMETFTPGELAMVKLLDHTAPDGAVLIEAVHDTPWRDTKYATYTYHTLLPSKPQSDAPTLTCGHVEGLAGRAGAYLLVTHSQLEASSLLGIGPPGGVQHFLDTCRLRTGWSVLAENQSGILIHIEGTHHAKPKKSTRSGPSPVGFRFISPSPDRTRTPEGIGIGGAGADWPGRGGHTLVLEGRPGSAV